MARKKTWLKISSALKEEHEFRAVLSFSVIIGWSGELAAKDADGFLVKVLGQFQFDGIPFL